MLLLNLQFILLATFLKMLVIFSEMLMQNKNVSKEVYHTMKTSESISSVTPQIDSHRRYISLRIKTFVQFAVFAIFIVLIVLLTIYPQAKRVLTKRLQQTGSDEFKYIEKLSQLYFAAAKDTFSTLLSLDQIISVDNSITSYKDKKTPTGVPK